MNKFAKIITLGAGLMLVIACISGCGGSDASSAASSAAPQPPASSTASEPTSTNQLKSVSVAGLQMQVPADFGSFDYTPGDPYGVYVSYEENMLGSILVSDLIPHEDITLAEFDEDMLAENLLSDYTSINWKSFETAKSFADGISYNIGACTMTSDTGAELASDVMVWEYDDAAFQLVVLLYAPEEDCTLSASESAVIASINPDNEAIANNLVA